MLTLPTIPSLAMDVQKRRRELVRARKKKQRNVMRGRARAKKQGSVVHAAGSDDSVSERWTNPFDTTRTLLPQSTQLEFERPLYLQNTRTQCDGWLDEYDIMDYTAVLEEEYEIVQACCGAHDR